MFVFIALLIFFAWSDLRIKDHIEACLLASILWEAALIRYKIRKHHGALEKIYDRMIHLRWANSE